MHIRCITNKYNLNYIIDVCEDSDFAKLTENLNWVDIDGTAKPGDYYYNNRVISLESEDYKIIEDIIFKQEEEERIRREQAEKLAQEAEEAKKAAEMQSLEAEEATGPIEPVVIALPADLSKLRAEAKSHPKPKSVDYFNDPQPEKFTKEDADMWDHRAVEIDRLISAVETATWDDHAVIYNPPHRIAPGTEFESVREYDVVPHDTKEEYLTYLRANAENIKKYRDYIKTQITK